MIKAVVTGVSGKMGSTICKGILLEEDIKLVAAVSKSKSGIELGKIIGGPNAGIIAVKTIKEALKS
ncbi:MAG: hypothetical protein ABIA56_03425, partial [Actinomycetota bacterium]